VTIGASPKPIEESTGGGKVKETNTEESVEAEAETFEVEEVQTVEHLWKLKHRLLKLRKGWMIQWSYLDHLFLMIFSGRRT